MCSSDLLGALSRTSEPGVWMTTVRVGDAGRSLDLSGESRDGAAVLRYAEQLNRGLAPLGTRLNQLELNPSSRAPRPGEAPGALAFHLF